MEENRMQIGIRLHDAAPGSMEERMKTVAGQGFSCVHLALKKTVTEHSTDIPALTPGYAMHVKRLSASCGLDIAVLGCYLNLAHPDPVKLRNIQSAYCAHLRFASLLGCGVVGTETGAPNEAYAYEPACHGEEALRTLIRNLRPVIRCAESFGVIFAIEPVWNHIVYDSKRALRVIHEMDSPNLQIILDPVNLLCAQNFEDRERIIGEAMEDLKDYIAVVHLKDFNVREGRLEASAPGTGLMDYGEILKFIRKEKPYIHVTLEDTKPENAEAARKHLSV